MLKKRSPQMEEYLETLVRYKNEERIPKVTDLAKDLKVSSSSVSEMLKKLSQKGFIKYQRYGEIILTKKGEDTGRAVLRKHKLIERFLEFIGVRKSKIHDEACVLEHALSDEVEKALRATLSDYSVNDENVRSLADMKKGETGTVLFILGGCQSSKRLTDMGLTPGTKLEVARASGRTGSVGINIRSSCLAIGRGLAKKIYIEVAT